MSYWWLLFRLAARNLARNRRRTFLAALAIALGLAALIVSNGIILGTNENMIRVGTDLIMGHAQIHAVGFREFQELEKTIQDAPELLRRLADHPDVAAFTPRAVAFAMVSSPANMASVTLYGIDPTREPALSQVDEAIVAGEYLQPQQSGRILLGEKLAQTLQVQVGDRVVLTVAQADTGELAMSAYRVGGIFSFASREMSAAVAFLTLQDAQELYGLGNRIHEIAVRFHALHYADNPNAPFWRDLASPGNEVLSWRQLMPELDAALQATEYQAYIVGGILFSIVAFGIINTLFMSLYERMFEFGVLRAIGTRPGRLAAMILAEGAILALWSILIGATIGVLAAAILAQIGLDFTGIDYAGITFHEPIRPMLHWSQFVRFPLWVFLFTLVAALYPAWYAARLKPAQAMRRSL